MFKLFVIKCTTIDTKDVMKMETVNQEMQELRINKTGYIETFHKVIKLIFMVGFVASFLCLKMSVYILLGKRYESEI